MGGSEDEEGLVPRTAQPSPVNNDLDAEIVPPFPWKEVMIIVLVVSCDSIAFTQVFPYLGFFIKYLGMASDVREVGRYAGYLAGIYSIMQFFSAPIWGAVSDRIGRRPTLLIGLTGTFISTLLFGFATNFVWAMVARSLWGMLNGNLGVAKCYISERTHERHQTRAWSLFSAGGSIGRIVGPAIGGWLVEPSKSMPYFFDDEGLFGTAQFPYLLPSLISSCLTFLGLITAYCFLVETLDPKFLVPVWSLCCCCCRRRRAPALLEAEIGMARSSKRKAAPRSSRSQYAKLGAASVASPVVATAALDENENDDDDEEEGAEGNDLPSFPDTGSSKSPANQSLLGPTPRSTGPAVSASCLGGTDDLKAVPAEFEVRVSDGGSLASGVDEGKSAEPMRRNDRNRTVKFRETGVSDASSGDDDQRGLITAEALNGAGAGYGQDLERERNLVTPTLVDPPMLPLPASPACPSVTVKVVEVEGEEEEEEDEGEEEGEVREKEEEEDSTMNPAKRATFGQLLCDKHVMVASLLYGLLGFGQAMFQEVLPIWSINQQQYGGIGFSSAQNGILNMCSGATLILSQLFLYPRLARRFGPLTLFRMAMHLLGLVFGLAPWASLLASERVLLWSAMLTDLGLQVALSQIAYTCTFQIIRLSTATQNLGLVNGISQSLIALTRAVGPALGSVLLAWSLNNNLAFPLDYHFVFLLCFFMNFIPIALSYTLGPKFNRI